MFDGTNTLHHIEFHTIQSSHLLDLFIRAYGFQLIAERITINYSQWLLKSNQCQLLISSLSDVHQHNDIQINNGHYDILNPIIENERTCNFVRNRDTAFNIAVRVKSIQSILDKNPDLQVIVPCRQATDKHGFIEYACIKSCIGNVVHTLIDESQYSGPFLPGFTPVSTAEKKISSQSVVQSIDHIAFAVEKQVGLSSVAWYEKVFDMKRSVVSREDDPFQGFTVRVGLIGMRLFASEYWKCSETACISRNASSMKFVFSESLIESGSGASDQITTFITQHKDQAGIQHVAFNCLSGIKNAVRKAKTNGAQFLSPLPEYYSKENNGSAIEAADENVSELAELGILLDNEIDHNDQSKPNKKVLLQIFTKSIFNNDTCFLELIERRGATGFGGGNIRTLWKIVQKHMDMEAKN